MKLLFITVFVCTQLTSPALGEAVLQAKMSLSAERISGFRISPNIPFLASYGSANGEVVILNLLTGKAKSKHRLFKALKGHQKQSTIYTSTYSTDDNFLAVARSTEAEIQLIDISSGEHTKIVDRNSAIKGFGGLRFSQDGSLLLASIWRERAVAIFNAQTGKEIARVKEEISPGSIFLPSVPLAFMAIAGTNLIVEINPRRTTLWNYQTQQRKELFSPPRLDPFADRTLIRAAAVSEDGQMSLLLLRDASDEGAASFHLAIQDNLTGRLVHQTKVAIPGGYFASLKLNAAELIATGFVAGKFLIWQPREKSLVIHATTSEWLAADFGWPASIPFESYVANELSYGFSIIDDGVVGKWILQ